MKRKFTKSPAFIIGIGLFVYLALMIILQYAEKNDPDASIQNLADAMWFSIVTLTTVGYGDYYPVSAVGKVIGLILVLGSIGLMGYIIGNLSNKYAEYMDKKKLGLLGTKFTDHVVIIGWDDFARLVTNQIVQASNQVAIVTDQKNDIDIIHDLFGDNPNVFALFADYHNVDALALVNIKESHNIFLNHHDDTQVLVNLLNLKKEYPTKDIVVSLNNSDLKETFQAAGVKYVISKNDIASKLVASYVFEPDVATFTEDIMASAVHYTNDFDMMQFKVINSNPYVKKDCGHVFTDMKKSYNAIFMGLSKNMGNDNYELFKNPSAEVMVDEGDYIIIVSNIEAREKVEADFGVEEGI